MALLSPHFLAWCAEDVQLALSCLSDVFLGGSEVSVLQCHHLGPPSRQSLHLNHPFNKCQIMTHNPLALKTSMKTTQAYKQLILSIYTLPYRQQKIRWFGSLTVHLVIFQRIASQSGILSYKVVLKGDQTSISLLQNRKVGSIRRQNVEGYMCSFSMRYQ